MGNISIVDLFGLPNLGVLVVDMQVSFVNQLFSEGEEELLIESSEIILNIAKKKNLPSILVEFQSKQVTPGNTIPEIFDLFKKLNNKLILEKQENSAFSNPLVHRFFQNNNVKNLIVIGLNASICVKESCISARSLNYEIYTSSRLISDYASVNKNKSITWYIDNTNIINFG